MKSHHRKTEFLLLLAVQIVLVFGMALVFGGKKATTDYPAQSVNINTATAAQLAQALSVAPDTAQALVAARRHFSSPGGWSTASCGSPRPAPTRSCCRLRPCCPAWG